MLPSAFGLDEGEKEPEEAVVRLATSALPSNKIMIDTEIGDRIADNAESRALIAHRRLGHVSEKKVLDTSKVADNVPSSINRHIHCTSCSKGKMHIVPHSRNAWVEKAKHRHDAWHLDLIGKFRVPSLGGNSYVLTIIDNYSRYCTAVPIKDKRAATVLQAFKKCIAELRAKPRMVYTDWGT